jgi:hypothetical protein
LNGCPWDETTCSGAAYNGYLEILKWAIDNGCKLDDVTYSCIIRYSNPSIVKWVGHAHKIRIS